MSLRIIKAGILDTLQDTGRYGYQHLGINPSGAMDRFSAQLANALLGKALNTPVLELHFPALQVIFEEPTIICITGADFSPSLNGQSIPRHHPVCVCKGDRLKFDRMINGARAYMAVWHDLKIDKWMNSYSTNLKANAGGWKGKALATGERIPFYDQKKALPLGSNSSVVLPWKAAETVDNRSEIQFVIGSEWMWLTDEARESFQENLYQVSNDADRMGYRINGKELQLNQQEQLVSSAVNFGTVQLLPNGHMIILMADHQTTGGYPRVAHIISAHLPILAQKKVNDVLQFRMTDLVTAEQKLTNQQKYLQQLQIACKFKMENYLHASM